MSVSPESVQQLINSEDFGDRIKGINQLRDLDIQTAFNLVKPLIKDPNTRVRYAAVSQLDTIGQNNRQESLNLLRDRLLNDTEADVQAAAADVIAALKFTEAFPDLEKLYHQTSEWLIQMSIVASLGEFGDPRGFDILKEAINSDLALIKTAAVSAFGELGDKRAIPLLTPLVDDPDWQIRYRLIQALTHLGTDEVIPTLEKLTQDAVPEVARSAREHLASLQ